MAILCLEEDRHGNGRHLWDITGYQYAAYAKVSFPSNHLFSLPPTTRKTNAITAQLHL